MQMIVRFRHLHLGAAAIAVVAGLVQIRIARGDEIEVEAFAGEPLGVGKITVLAAPGRAQRISTSDRENRVLYPTYDEVISPGEMVADRELPRSTTAYFLFRGDQPLELTLERWYAYRDRSYRGIPLFWSDDRAHVTLDTRRIALAVPAKDPAHHAALLKEWWRAHSAMVAQLAAADAYPPQVENYVSGMLSHRLKLAAPKVVRRWSGFPEIDEILGTLLGAESVRLAMQNETLLKESTAIEKPDLPLPRPVTPPPVEIPNVPGYERARATSAGNAHFMHALRQQLRVPLPKCAEIMQEVLAARPVCPLGGKYAIGRGDSWRSTAWPEEFLVSEDRVPEGYKFPFLQWFHGLELEFSIDATSLTTHIELELAP